MEVFSTLDRGVSTFGETKVNRRARRGQGIMPLLGDPAADKFKIENRESKIETINSGKGLI
jgi:hypothetical protein